LWGGRGHFGIDCSGFSQLVFRLCGIKLPRDAYQQAELGEIIKPTKSIKGDLAFFENNMGKINHVGIVLEKNKIIHSSGKVRIDELNANGIYNSDSKSITHTLAYIKRLF
jgi:cell wall-associated NlpC family hydrolase